MEDLDEEVEFGSTYEEAYGKSINESDYLPDKNKKLNKRRK